MICGRNEKLAQALRQERSRIPIHVGVALLPTSRISCIKALSDFFIGKPGPGSISEALSEALACHHRLQMPAVDIAPGTLQRTKWVREKEVGIVVKHHREVAAAVEELLKPGELPRLREHAASMHNQAIFEVPQIFEKILNNGSAPK